MKIADKVRVVSGYERDKNLCAGNTGHIVGFLHEDTPFKVVLVVVDGDTTTWPEGAGWAYYGEELEVVQ